MKLSTYLSAHGSQTELARAIGAQPQLIWQWSTGVRKTPIERCVPIERATNGAVTRQDLRPDDWAAIWPELAQSATSPAPGAGGHETPPGPQDAGTADTDLGTYMGDRVVFLSGERRPLRLTPGDDRYVIVNEADPPATPQSPPLSHPAPAGAGSAPPAPALALLSSGKE